MDIDWNNLRTILSIVSVVYPRNDTTIPILLATHALIFIITHSNSLNDTHTIHYTHITYIETHTDTAPRLLLGHASLRARARGLHRAQRLDSRADAERDGLLHEQGLHHTGE